MTSWESIWAGGVGPGDKWDVGGASKCLLEALPKLPASKTAFVPGAGRAYDALALAETGREVVALDISPTACEAARALIGDKTGVAVVCEDFFEHKATYDLIWDCTFLCALPPDMREAWARQSVDLLAPGGGIATMIFPMGKPSCLGGPPFGLNSGDVKNLLEPLGLTPAFTLELPRGTHLAYAPYGNMVVYWERRI
ncbi:hypothetical protein CTAYLR_000894 [Chrysophaeum taylorii]|uniref:SAM-dependent methyltransferase n=1 Tax=Chrysophaeum taylorii TaxID=2483200 RepID=A0AAD7XJE5_9STRA|nr:hypothetical protein CTAYLR_000894 [Chrysophaeum taylorii]